MSGDFYYFCEDCFSQWFTDGEDCIGQYQCLECGGTNIGAGDLGKKGDMVRDIMTILRNAEEERHESFYEHIELLREMAYKYFELGEDFEDPEDVLERMEEEY